MPGVPGAQRAPAGRVGGGHPDEATGPVRHTPLARRLDAYPHTRPGAVQIEPGAFRARLRAHGGVGHPGT
eukprot:scaffold21833_cov152-Isochrysis_galbana.AAC.3